MKGNQGLAETEDSWGRYMQTDSAHSLSSKDVVGLYWKPAMVTLQPNGHHSYPGVGKRQQFNKGSRGVAIQRGGRRAVETEEQGGITSDRHIGAKKKLTETEAFRQNRSSLCNNIIIYYQRIIYLLTCWKGQFCICSLLLTHANFWKCCNCTLRCKGETTRINTTNIILSFFFAQCSNGWRHGSRSGWREEAKSVGVWRIRAVFTSKSLPTQRFSCSLSAETPVVQWRRRRHTHTHTQQTVNHLRSDICSSSITVFWQREDHVLHNAHCS